MRTAETETSHFTEVDVTALTHEALSKRVQDLTHEINRLSRQMWDRKALPQDDTYQEKDRVRRLRSAAIRELHGRKLDLLATFEALWKITYKDQDGVERTAYQWSDYFASKPGHNGHGTPTTKERIDNLYRAEHDFKKANPGVNSYSVAARFVRSRTKGGAR